MMMETCLVKMAETHLVLLSQAGYVLEALLQLRILALINVEMVK